MRFKKIMAGVLASAMTLSAGILPNITSAMQTEITASAKEDLKYGDYLSYKKVDEDKDGTYDHVRIYDCDRPAVSVEIPSEIDGLPVTTIGNDAFSYCKNLESITIPDSVTTIGNHAFSYCTSLASVTIPDSVTTIDYRAFYYCTSLASVTIPDSVTTISDSTFCFCESLKSITIPDSVTSIGETAFFSCESLESVTIPDSVITIGEDAFCFCESLKSVTIPDSVTEIGNRAFQSCKSLESIDVTENNKYYSSIDGVLFNKDKTEIIQYPAGNKNAAYTIPDSVITIGEDAFYSCERLESITIPDSVTSIGNGAFQSRGSLKSIDVKENNKYYSSIDGVLLNKDKTEIIQYPAGNKSTAYTIPDSVTSIGDMAFVWCTSLASVTIPDSVTSIGEWAFSATSLLDNQTGVKYADKWVVDCDEDIISAIEIKEGTKGISDSAFSYCQSLKSVTIPDSVTTIGDYAFSYCYDLESIDVAENNKYYSSIDGVLFNKDKTEIIQYPDGNKNTAYTIPDSVISIGLDAFSYCEILESVTISDSVTSIGKWAFYGCTSLASVTIPDSVTSIGDMAFYRCTSLSSIRILNPDCEIYDSEYTITNRYNDHFDGTIYGYKDSTSQAYAKKYGYKFESLGEYTPSWSVADIIALQNYLLKKTDSIGKYYDLNNDGKLNVFDLVILKRKVIYG